MTNAAERTMLLRLAEVADDQIDEQRKKNDALEAQVKHLAAEVARLSEELRVANADITRYLGEWV